MAIWGAIKVLAVLGAVVFVLKYKQAGAIKCANCGESVALPGIFGSLFLMFKDEMTCKKCGENALTANKGNQAEKDD